MSKAELITRTNWKTNDRTLILRYFHPRDFSPGFAPRIVASARRSRRPEIFRAVFGEQPRRGNPTLDHSLTTPILHIGGPATPRCCSCDTASHRDQSSTGACRSCGVSRGSSHHPRHRSRSCAGSFPSMASSLPPPFRRKSVTHVSGTFCYLCLGSLPAPGLLEQHRLDMSVVS